MIVFQKSFTVIQQDRIVWQVILLADLTIEVAPWRCTQVGEGAPLLRE